MLTLAWRAIYRDEGEPSTLELGIAPMQATEEISQLFTAGLVPRPIAMKAVLTSIGVASDEIDRAVKDAEEEDKQRKELRCRPPQQAELLPFRTEQRQRRPLLRPLPLLVLLVLPLPLPRRSARAPRRTTRTRTTMTSRLRRAATAEEALRNRLSELSLWPKRRHGN